MMNPAEYRVEQIQFFLLLFVRVSVMIMVFPILGSRQVPWQLKTGLAFILSAILLPLVMPKAVNLPNDLLPYGILIMKEALAGLVIGFAASLIFTGISMAGAIIDNQVGFGISRAMDPVNEAGSTVLGHFLVVLFTLIFLTLDGHQFLILAIAKSCETIPLAQVNLPTGPLAQTAAQITGAVFDVGVRLSAPVMILVMLVSVASGVLSRTLPQMNLFVVDMPVKIAAAFLALAAALPFMLSVFEKTYARLQEDIFQLLMIMA